MGNVFEKQFTEARNARKVTLEEAAEATKIRVKYLEAIENGLQDIDIPHIYTRGFIKVYAQYLMMDVDDVMAKCPIKDFETSDAKPNKKGSYNTIVTNEKEKEEDADAGVNDKVLFSEKLQGVVCMLKNIAKNRRLMAVIVSVLAMLILSIFVSKISHPKSNNPETSITSINKTQEIANQSTISLIATGNIQVVVRIKESGEKIFAGTVESGTIKKISYSHPIQIFYNNGEFLLIKQANGEQLYPQPGRGAVEIK